MLKLKIYQKKIDITTDKGVDLVAKIKQAKKIR